MKCKDCTIWACIRRKDGEQQCYYEEKKTAYEDVFWYRFRAEAAKDILCAIIAKFGTSSVDMNDVVKWADSLIAKLKEKD